VLLDPVGIRWLPTLALNELPPEIAGLGHAPQDLLERMTFRLLTLALRFGGERLGEAQRGHRLPDAVLRWDRGKAALLDCKAARDGYVMDADHELRFANYANALSEQLQAAGAALHYIVVVSSEFPGNVARHPHVARAASLRERAGVDLVYLRALDLARLALAVEASELSPAEREALGWASAFDRGLVTFSDLEALLP
jgi:hypothetical protein